MEPAFVLPFVVQRPSNLNNRSAFHYEQNGRGTSNTVLSLSAFDSVESEGAVCVCGLDVARGDWIKSLDFSDSLPELVAASDFQIYWIAVGVGELGIRTKLPRIRAALRRTRPTLPRRGPSPTLRNPSAEGADHHQGHDARKLCHG
jgi:hypothetical protein